jgi:hypothetical protein
MGDPTSSYTTASIALRVLEALKPHHHDKVETQSVGISVSYTLKSARKSKQFIFLGRNEKPKIGISSPIFFPVMSTKPKMLDLQLHSLEHTRCSTDQPQILTNITIEANNFQF